MYQDRLHTFTKGNGTKTRIHTRESQAIRDIRIFKRISRKEISKLIGKSVEMVKKYEDGRCNYSPEARSILLRRVRYTRSDFQKILDGEIKIPKLSAKAARSSRENSVPRTRKQVISKESKILKILRKKAKLTQEQAAKLCGLSRNMIDHREAGRVDLSNREKEIRHIVRCYGYKIEEYYNRLNSDILRDEIVENCLKTLEIISDDKLKAVQALLINFK